MPSLADDIFTGLENITKYLNGENVNVRVHHVKVPTSINVRAIRQRLNVTQEQFANFYGFTLSAVKDWEQERRNPERSARVLLKVIDYDPNIVSRALNR